MLTNRCLVNVAFLILSSFDDGADVWAMLNDLAKIEHYSLQEGLQEWPQGGLKESIVFEICWRLIRKFKKKTNIKKLLDTFYICIG